MSDIVIQNIIKTYNDNGESYLYKTLIVNSIKKITLLLNDKNFNNSPDKELISLYEKFMYMYRTEGDEVYLNIAKIIRKAAHKIYRVLLKQNYIKKDEHFLNLV